MRKYLVNKKTMKRKIETKCQVRESSKRQLSNMGEEITSLFIVAANLGQSLYSSPPLTKHQLFTDAVGGCVQPGNKHLFSASASFAYAPRAPTCSQVLHCLIISNKWSFCFSFFRFIKRTQICICCSIYTKTLLN